MSPKTRPSTSHAAAAPAPRPRPSLTPPPVLITAETEKEIESLAKMASVPGAEKMTTAFLNDYGLKSRPANEEEGEARVALFKKVVRVKNVDWSATTLVKAGLAFPQPRKVKSKGRKELAPDPCGHCLAQDPPLECVMTIVDDGMSLKNYCDACSASKSKCSIGPARAARAIALATSVGAGLRGMGTELRSAGFQGDGPLATAGKLMEDVLNLLQVLAPLASSTVRRALAGADNDTQKLSESIVNPVSASGPSQSRGPSRRPFSRAPTVKSEYRGRGSPSPYKGNRSPWKGKAKAVDSEEEEGSRGSSGGESDRGDSEDGGSSSPSPRDLKRVRR